MENKKIRHVYFVKNPATNLVKIGASIDPLKRKKQLEGDVGNQLQLLYVYLGGGKAKEKEFHKRFEQYQVKGEWFKFGWKLKWFIMRIKKNKSVWIGKEASLPTKQKNYNAKKNKRQTGGVNPHIPGSKQVSVKIDPKLYKKIKRLAEMNERSVPNMMHVILAKVFGTFDFEIRGFKKLDEFNKAGENKPKIYAIRR